MPDAALSRRHVLTGAGATVAAAALPAVAVAAPAAGVPPQATVLGPEPDDVLGYFERDPVDAVLHMARDAVAGVNQDVVEREAESFSSHFGVR